MSDEPSPKHSAPRRAIFALGTIIAGCQVRALLSQGRRGQTFLAHDPGLDRDVVIKAVWRGEDFTPERTEARLLAAFRHPGLPTIHAVGNHAGADYVMSERVVGVTLAEHLAKRARDGGFSLTETLDVMIALCDTLAILHGAALAHDEVSPRTIFLATGGRVVLVGTGHPEAEVDVHAARLRDTYAVGLVGFEMLTGSLPVAGEPIAPQLAARCAQLPEPLVTIIAEMVDELGSARPRRIELVGARLRALQAPSRGQLLDVLIADDDPDARRLLAAIVRQAAPDAQVRFASDGAETLRLIQRRPPDVLLVDLEMPEMTGLEVLMYLTGTRLGEHITICVMSRFAETHRGLLHGLGVVDTFVKGEHSATELVAALRGVFQRIGLSAEPRQDNASSETTVGNRYVLGRTLGSGGMGTVYEARHLQLSRRFALKLLDAELSKRPEARARFLQEARLASELTHPNIVSVVDFGDDPVVGAYLVMDLVEGTLLGTARLSLRRVCDVLGQVADALGMLHKHGIVHGDVKAENIMVLDEVVGTRRRSVVRLLDFGLANRITSDAEDSETIAGTPHYLAPERALGGPPTVAADVYALGVLGFLLITGALPFDGDADAVLRAQVEDALPPIISARGEPIDPALANLIERTMAKDSTQRHASMAAFRYELNTVMDMLELGRRRARTVVIDGSGITQLFTRSRFAQAIVSVDGEVLTANDEFRALASPDLPAFEALATRVPVVKLALASARARGTCVECRAQMITVRVAPIEDRHLHVMVWHDDAESRITG